MLLATAGPSLAAGPIVDTGGFESFTLGPLGGQQGWLTAGAGGSSATVQSATVLSGSKAVTVQRAANSDRRWAKPVTGFPTQRFVVIDWDMRVAFSGASNTFGPFFGVEAYDGSVASAQTPPGVLGSLGVDATTGDVLYQAAGTGALTETGVVATFDTWNHFRIVLDFSTDMYHAFVNGTKVAAPSFVDASFNLNQFTDADIATFAAAGDAVANALTGTAHFDNFTVWHGVIGDFDVDGDVDGNDLTTWKSAYGTSALGDADGDNDSDGADFLLWQRQRGRNVLGPVGSPGVASSVAAVPEPACVALALMAAMGLWKRERG
jgi:hypothetical protein